MGAINEIAKFTLCPGKGLTYNVTSVHLLKANGTAERKILTTSVFSERFFLRDIEMKTLILLYPLRRQCEHQGNIPF